MHTKWKFLSVFSWFFIKKVDAASAEMPIKTQNARNICLDIASALEQWKFVSRSLAQIMVMHAGEYIYHDDGLSRKIGKKHKINKWIYIQIINIISQEEQPRPANRPTLIHCENVQMICLNVQRPANCKSIKNQVLAVVMLLSGQIYHKYENHPHYGQKPKFRAGVCVCACVFFIAVSTRPLGMLTDNMVRLRQPLR